MDQSPPNSFVAEDSIVSKLEHSGWLPYWRFNPHRYPHSAIIPIFLKYSIFPDDYLANAGDILRANQALSSFQALLGFSGMAYCMADKRYPDEVKIGESKTDALARMRQSPWTSELGRIPHQYREVVFALVCLNIESNIVETAFHRFFQFRDLQLPKSFGRGREWFFADSLRIKEAVRYLTRSSGEEIWIRGLTRACDTESGPPNISLSNGLLGADFLIANRPERDLRPQAVCM